MVGQKTHGNRRSDMFVSKRDSKGHLSPKRLLRMGRAKNILHRNGNSQDRNQHYFHDEDDGAYSSSTANSGLLSSSGLPYASDSDCSNVVFSSDDGSRRSRTATDQALQQWQPMPPNSILPPTPPPPRRRRTAMEWEEQRQLQQQHRARSGGQARSQTGTSANDTHANNNNKSSNNDNNMNRESSNRFDYTASQPDFAAIVQEPAGDPSSSHSAAAPKQRAISPTKKQLKALTKRIRRRSSKKEKKEPLERHNPAFSPILEETPSQLSKVVSPEQDLDKMNMYLMHQKEQHKQQKKKKKRKDEDSSRNNNGKGSQQRQGEPHTHDSLSVGETARNNSETTGRVPVGRGERAQKIRPSQTKQPIDQRYVSPKLRTAKVPKDPTPTNSAEWDEPESRQLDDEDMQQWLRLIQPDLSEGKHDQERRTGRTPSPATVPHAPSDRSNRTDHAVKETVDTESLKQKRAIEMMDSDDHGIMNEPRHNTGGHSIIVTVQGADGFVPKGTSTDKDESDALPQHKDRKTGHNRKYMEYAKQHKLSSTSSQDKPRETKRQAPLPESILVLDKSKGRKAKSMAASDEPKLFVRTTVLPNGNSEKRPTVDNDTPVSPPQTTTESSTDRVTVQSRDAELDTRNETETARNVDTDSVDGPPDERQRDDDTREDAPTSHNVRSSSSRTTTRLRTSRSTEQDLNDYDDGTNSIEESSSKEQSIDDASSHPRDVIDKTERTSRSNGKSRAIEPHLLPLAAQGSADRRTRGAVEPNPTKNHSCRSFQTAPLSSGDSTIPRDQPKPSTATTAVRTRRNKRRIQSRQVHPDNKDSITNSSLHDLTCGLYDIDETTEMDSPLPTPESTTKSRTMEARTAQTRVSKQQQEAEAPTMLDDLLFPFSWCVGVGSTIDECAENQCSDEPIRHGSKRNISGGYWRYVSSLSSEDDDDDEDDDGEEDGSRSEEDPSIPEAQYVLLGDENDPATKKQTSETARARSATDVVDQASNTSTNESDLTDDKTSTQLQLLVTRVFSTTKSGTTTDNDTEDDLDAVFDELQTPPSSAKEPKRLAETAEKQPSRKTKKKKSKHRSGSSSSSKSSRR